MKVKSLPSGCKHHPDCFTCPFPDCIADAPIGVEKATRLAKKARILELYDQQHLTVPEIVRETGLSPRTIRYYIRHYPEVRA